LVVVTADHGESLGEHGELTHGLFAYEATLKVPLIVWQPGRVRPARDRRPARHVDIFPTAVEAVGLPIPATIPGRSLISAAGDAGASNYFESLSTSLNRGWAPLTGIVRGGFKFIDLPIPELYDLASDPKEERNLFGQRRDLAADLKRLIPPLAAKVEAAPADSEETRRLLSLGYLSGSARRKETYGPEDDPKRLVDVDAKIQRVVDLFQKGALAEAAALARQLVARQPDMPIGYEFLAFLLQSTGRDAEAAALLAEAQRRGIASEAMQVRLALVLSESGRAAEAVEVLRPFEGSPDPDTQNALGLALADAGRIPEALAVYRRILERDPADAVAFQNWGIALLKQGDARGAVERFDRALAIHGNLPRSWNARGVAQARLGDAGGAIASWRRAIELDPRQFDALFNLGMVAGQQGDLRLAREALTRFAETAPPALYAKDIEQVRGMLRKMGGA
jgi:tetratricopeptide (TPR) repeat protein